MDKIKSENVCEERVFKQLFFEQSKNIRNFLYYKSGDFQLAEDLMQEAFLRLWKKCQQVSYPKAKSFLFTVANNLFLDEIKHRKVVQQFKLKPVRNKFAESPQYLLEEKEFEAQLERAIAELSEKNRVVFLLNRIDQLTYKEIAELEGISVKAVEKRMHKALIKLRQLTDKI